MRNVFAVLAILVSYVFAPFDIPIPPSGSRTS